MLAEVAMAQEVPSHRSISVCELLTPVSVEPTAQQADADTHVTPERELLWVVLELGELTMAHEVPSHRATRVGRYGPGSSPPTAQQSAADTHVTPKKMLVVALALGEALLL